MEESSGKSKIWNRVRNSLWGFLVLIVAGWAAGYFLARPLIESKIKNAFARATAGRYELSFDRLDISYQEMGISIRNIHIRPKADSLQALSHTSLLELSCSKVSILRINFWRTFFGKTFSADELELENPQLQVWYDDSTQPTPLRKKDTKHIGYLHLGKIRIKNANAVVKSKKDLRLLYETKKLNLFVEAFGLSSDLVPLYSHFSLESENNSLSIFPNQSFKLGKLFMAGNVDYTGLNASEFDISEIDSSLRKTLKIPDEISFSIDAISLESQSLQNLAEQFINGQTDKINISKLLLVHPQVSIETRRMSDDEPAETSEKLERVSKKLSLPQIDKMGILDGEFLWLEPGEKKPVLRVSDIHIMSTDLRPRFGQKIPLSYSTAEVNTGPITFTYPKSDYSFYAARLNYRSVTDSLKIEGFQSLPHKGIDSFYMDKKWRVDRFEFSCDTVHFHRLRIADFAFKNQFNPETVVFKNPEIKAYTDKRLHHDPSFVKPFPLKKLREVKGKYQIGRIVFLNGKATYSEKVADSPGLGTLKIDHANLEIENIKSHPQATDTAYVHFNCTLGGGSYAEMHLDIPLFGEDEIQFGRGTIRHLPFKQLNSITENTVFMGFASGELDSCRFSFKAVNGESEGSSVFHYNNLKVKIYKVVDVPSYKAKILFNKTFVSLAANFLLNKNNPTEEGYSIPGKLSFKRDPLKGPLNFWIRTIMTGLMNTVIDDISELKDLQEEIKSLKSESKTGILSKMKADPAKKAIRKQAREARKAIKNEDETK